MVTSLAKSKTYVINWLLLAPQLRIVLFQLFSPTYKETISITLLRDTATLLNERFQFALNQQVSSSVSTASAIAFTPVSDLAVEINNTVF